MHFSNEEKASVKIYGYASIPTYNFSTFFHQNIFVNKRIIKDKLISASVRIAYRNLMASNRYPAIILFIEIGNTDVDVNVHPTKSEVRFKDPNQLKSLIINTIRSGITNTPLRTSTKITKEAALLFKPSQTLNSIPSTISSKNKQHSLTITGVNSHAFKESEFKISETFQKQTPSKNIFALDDSRVDKYQHQTKKNYTKHEENPSPPQNHEIGLLGHAKCQINKTYIISQSEDGLILVDQHAAHERITLHNIKQELKNGSVKSQILLIPEVMELSDSLIENLLEKKGNLLKFGIEIERNGKNQIAVRRIPAIMGNANPRSLIETIAENIYVFNDVDLLESKIDEIWGNIACHFSIRSGKILTLEEMDSLLREMEKTPLTSQCNHGRPTFVKLSFNDIEKIFERI